MEYSRLNDNTMLLNNTNIKHTGKKWYRHHTSNIPIFYPMLDNSMTPYIRGNFMNHSNRSRFIDQHEPCSRGRGWINIGYVQGNDNNLVLELCSRPNLLLTMRDPPNFGGSTLYKDYQIISTKKVQVPLNIIPDKVLRDGDTVNVPGYEKYNPFRVKLNNSAVGIISYE
jgi:hypothetical protein